MQTKVPKVVRDTAPPDQLAGTLRTYIRQYGSVKKLADEAGVPQPCVSRFLAGSRDITLGTAAKLAAVLGLNFTEKL